MQERGRTKMQLPRNSGGPILLLKRPVLNIEHLHLREVQGLDQVSGGWSSGAPSPS